MEPTPTSPVTPEAEGTDEPVQMASSAPTEPTSTEVTASTGSDSSSEPIETASTTNVTETADNAEKSKESRGKPPVKRMLLFSLVILLLFAVAAAAYWYGFRESPSDPDTSDDTIEEPVDEDPDPIDEPVDVLLPEGDPLPSVLFHVKDYDIYMYDVDTDTEQLLVDHSEDVMNVGRIVAIDEDNIGFGSCETVEGDLGCALYTYEISTNTLTTVRELGPDDYLLEYDFYDVDTYAYAIDVEATAYTLYMVDGVQVRVADEVTEGEPYGRGGFEDDDQNLSFNPDGTRFFDINTSSPRGGLDFNIYIFNVDDLLKSTIEDATQPDWIDNDRLIYKSGDGLVVTDLSTGDTTDVTPAGQVAFNPSVLRGGEIVLYAVDLGTENPAVWSLDLSDDSTEIVQENATSPMWVSDELYVFEMTEPCTDMCMGYWQTVSVALSTVPPEELTLVEYLYTAGSHY